MCAVHAKGWWWLLHAGGVDEPPVAYGRPAHAQHVYLPFYQGHMTYTTRKSLLVIDVLVVELLLEQSEMQKIE